MKNQYPPDADGDALNRIAKDGSDMSKPMGIDFFVAVATEGGGHLIANAANQLGYETEIVFDEESGDLTCYCTKVMVPEYDAVIEAQKELDQLAKPHEGFSDGWGTLGNSLKP
ncbi:MAG: ribonuclease E inhibitor RraB [Acidobacteriota bacterium]